MNQQHDRNRNWNDHGYRDYRSDRNDDQQRQGRGMEGRGQSDDDAGGGNGGRERSAEDSYDRESERNLQEHRSSYEQGGGGYGQGGGYSGGYGGSHGGWHGGGGRGMRGGEYRGNSGGGYGQPFQGSQGGSYGGGYGQNAFGGSFGQDQSSGQRGQGQYGNWHGSQNWQGDALGQSAWSQGQSGRGPAASSERGKHWGRGPKGYRRSDDRVQEEVCEALKRDSEVDATNVEVEVKDGEVMLRGTVASRREKRLAEDCVEAVSGVENVQNHLRVSSADGNGSDAAHESGRRSSASEITGSSVTHSMGMAGTQGQQAAQPRRQDQPPK